MNDKGGEEDQNQEEGLTGGHRILPLFSVSASSGVKRKEPKSVQLTDKSPKWAFERPKSLSARPSDV